VNDAEKLRKDSSKVYQQESCTFEELKPDLQNAVTTIGQRFLQNLRCPSSGTPGSLQADIPANVQKTKETQKDVIIEIVDEVADQIEQRQNKIEPNAMPKSDPPELLNYEKNGSCQFHGKNKTATGLRIANTFRRHLREDLRIMRAPIRR